MEDGDDNVPVLVLSEQGKNDFEDSPVDIGWLERVLVDAFDENDPGEHGMHNTFSDLDPPPESPIDYFMRNGSIVFRMVDVMDPVWIGRVECDLYDMRVEKEDFTEESLNKFYDYYMALYKLKKSCGEEW